MFLLIFGGVASSNTVHGVGLKYNATPHATYPCSWGSVSHKVIQKLCYPT